MKWVIPCIKKVEKKKSKIGNESNFSWIYFITKLKSVISIYFQNKLKDTKMTKAMDPKKKKDEKRWNQNCEKSSVY